MRFLHSVALTIALIILSGCATDRDAGPPPVAPEPNVPAATWKLVEQEVLLASLKARSQAYAGARKAENRLMKRVRRYTEEDFIDWYAGYWTQEWLAVKVAAYQSDDAERDAAAVRHLAEYLQEQYISRVLEPASAEIAPITILHQATAVYAQSLRGQIEAIGQRFQLPEKAFRNWLGRIPAISSGEASDSSTSLEQLVRTDDVNDLAAYEALLQEIDWEGLDNHYGLSKYGLSPVAGAVAELFVRRVATRGGAAAAALVGGPLGFVVSAGITMWGITEHDKQKPELEIQVRKVLNPALEKMQRNLIGDPQYGVLGAVNHINMQIRDTLQIEPAEPEWPSYQSPW